MTLESVVNIIHQVFATFNYLLFGGAAILATGLLWDLRANAVKLGLSFAFFFLGLGAFEGFLLAGNVFHGLALKGAGGRGFALGYGILVGLFIVLVAKVVVRDRK
jgi:hypothetical protein